MPNTQFQQVNYTLAGLLDQIEMGTIGLPDLQRPFVWKPVKVRDLFDSMYRGYPIGYLLFWHNIVEPGARQIGSDGKQLAPQQLIVDGQQRLTSLYTVVKSEPVVTADYKLTRIRIAFRPLDERFEVANPAIEKDAEWIPDISKLWEPGTGLLQFIRGYVERLAGTREVSDGEALLYEGRIQELWNIQHFPFTALVLSSTLDEQMVSEIFVRINSEGVRLNQADFILTLMSVFWDKGRKQLEEFCRSARVASTGEPSPFNYYIKPDPDQVLRVSVALAFRRARLQHVYSILRGKDLKTSEVSVDRRERQFTTLEAAQAAALDLTNWHEFFKAVSVAGYRGGRMLASETNLMYCYAIWLIGRVDFGVDLNTLRRVIARWFYMASVTSRYTGSSETQMEADMSRLRNLTTAEQFTAQLDSTCRSELTNDFWEIRLPNDLEKRSARTPGLFSYYAALSVLDAKVLFSKMTVSELLDPAVKGKKSAIERHHLFPRAYLESIGIKDLNVVNQIANYALVEWSDNIAISDSSPDVYYPEYVAAFSGAELDQQTFWHALPERWQSMDFIPFLAERRQLMARVIRAGWDALNHFGPSDKDGVADALSHAPEHWAVEELLERKESARVEFKSSARWNYQRGEKGKEIEDSVVKTVAGFMNRAGGTLIIGVDNDANVLGLSKDLSTIGRGDLDGFSNWINTLFEDALGGRHLGHVSVSFVEVEDEPIARVDVRKSSAPVFAKTSKSEAAFYVRAGTSTRLLNAEDAHAYINEHFQ